MAARCWSPAPPPTPASRWSSPACVGCWRARAFGSRRSRRRTCPTTRPSRSRAARSAAPRRCRPGPPGLAPSVRFNPVLLKPGGDRTSQLVVRGQVAGTVGAGDYFDHRDRARRGGRRRTRLAAKRIRRGHLRGRRLARRDQPAGNRSGQHGAGAGGGPPGRRGRRHRPRRAAGAPVRDRRGARTRRPAAHRGLRGQQVPRRPRAAGTRPRPARASSPGGRPTASSRTTTVCGSTRRTRCRCNRTGSSGCPQPPRGADCAAGGGRSGCRASPTPPTSRRWPASRACWSAGSPTPPTSPTPTSSSCRAARRRCPTWRGCANADSPTASSRTRRRGRAGARHLRRVPDAVPHHRRSGRVRPGSRRRARPAGRRHRLRRRQDAAALG